MNKPPKIKPKRISGRIKLLKALTYRGVIIYVRQIGDIFEYLVPYKDEVYTSYYVFTPEAGRKKLTPGQTITAMRYVFSAATTTIDHFYEE
jgi:hypothetical protein